MNRVQTHIIGCGDIGRRVAALHSSPGTHLEAWVKSKASYQYCLDMELITHRTDFDRPISMGALSNRSKILYTIPPPPQGVSDTRMANFLAAIPPEKIDKFVLISTTGVYGDCGGGIVDENTPIRPKAERALRRADAERRLQAWAKKNNTAYVILRVPGIYAAERLPLKRLRAGTPVVNRREAPWTNRIHADDLASICIAALNRNIENEIINVADDAPGTMTEYFIAVADYADLPRPPEISLREAIRTLSPGMVSYLSESRRIDNTKMKSMLGVQLQYPTLKHGLRSTP